MAPPAAEPVAGHARDGAAAPALAPSRVRRRPPVLLPDRGRRDGHLVHRSRAASRSGKRLLENLKAVNADANPHLERLALKLATGAGKTTVMAMLIAWQTLNAVRRPGSKHFTRGFLIVTPGLTIRIACASCSRTTRTTTTAPASWSRTTCSRT